MELNQAGVAMSPRTCCHASTHMLIIIYAMWPCLHGDVAMPPWTCGHASVEMWPYLNKDCCMPPCRFLHASTQMLAVMFPYIWGNAFTQKSLPFSVKIF